VSRYPARWSPLAGEYHDPAVRLLADRLGDDVRVVAQRDVDPSALQGGHGLELEHLARLQDPPRGPGREVAELPLAAAAVVLDVDQDPRPAAHPPREHQVDEVLQGRKPLALAADERAQGVLLAAGADDVQPARVTGLDLHPDVEPEVPHELLEDLAACVEGLR